MAFNTSFEDYFPDLDFETPSLNAMGVAWANVSVFDHWLSEDEADSSFLLTYDVSLKTGHFGDYLAGEEKFLRLYRPLMLSGMICNYPPPLRALQRGDIVIEEIVRNSLREKRIMDAYFPSHGIRILGGYDRTDLVVADSAEQLSAVTLEAERLGLFILK